ncbi:MAG: acyloxyacyl hydrolase [Bacteroides sp.]|nr:acyloxyacyl hydrolase [Bacteroides sp.]
MKRHPSIYRRSIACLCAWLVLMGALYAQEADNKESKVIHRIGFDLRPNYVTPTDNFFSGSNLAGEPIRQLWSAHLKYSFQLKENTKLGSLYPHTYQGIGISYNHFPTSNELGHPVNIYVFQGSRIKQLTSKLSLDYEWNFGVSFGWKKYDSNNFQYTILYGAPGYNDVVGSKINAYINLGLLLNWQIAPQWNLTAGLDFSHYSNGNTNYPNKGVNPIGGRIGIVHTFGTDKENSAPDTYRQASQTNIFRPHFSYDLILYGSTRRRGIIEEDGGYLVPGSFAVLGLNFNPMYNFNKYLRAGLSLDAQYDESANLKEHYAGDYDGDPKFYRPPFREQFAVGISARAELVMPIFSINIGIGQNIIYQGEDTEGFYQILALKTSITRNLFLHVGYQLSNFKNPNNLMLGLGWRFHT